MGIMVSELYGKKIISNEGNILGEVKGIMINLEDAAISHLLLTDAERLIRSSNPRVDLQKGSVSFKRVRKISENVIVGR